MNYTDDQYRAFAGVEMSTNYTLKQIKTNLKGHIPRYLDSFFLANCFEDTPVKYAKAICDGKKLNLY